MGQLLSTSETIEEKALIIGVLISGHKQYEVEDSLDELQQLAETAGAVIVERMIFKQAKPVPATFIGKGKAEEIAACVKDRKITTVVFDDDLSPAQGRNLEKIMPGVKILDRTQMILDIFAQHARTREGCLQIELAQLQYLIPRLKRMWTHLERQKGGIGLRGPGETQLEVDRRRIDERITRIRKELELVKARRAEQRRGRRRHGWALITLVGYTNAGKSTLLNTMTGAEVLAYDQLFATLDPTTRQINLPNNQPALVTDTVGFIRKLPHHLVESFKATLEEVNEADVLLNVIDASHPKVDDQVQAVDNVLRELGAENKTMVYVFNKTDCPLADRQASRLSRHLKPSVSVSAKTGAGMEALVDQLADSLKHRNVDIHVRIPHSEGSLIALIRQHGNIYKEEYEGQDVIIRAGVPKKMASRCEKFSVSSAQ